jgi:hypothetical protein
MMNTVPSSLSMSVDEAQVTGEHPLTRREAAQFLTERGFRISYATLAKLCSPAISEGPQSCGRWGRDSLYMPSGLLAWAQNRLQSPRSADAIRRRACVDAAPV